MNFPKADLEELGREILALRRDEDLRTHTLMSVAMSRRLSPVLQLLGINIGWYILVIVLHLATSDQAPPYFLLAVIQLMAWLCASTVEVAARSFESFFPVFANVVEMQSEEALRWYRRHTDWIFGRFIMPGSGPWHRRIWGFLFGGSHTNRWVAAGVFGMAPGLAFAIWLLTGRSFLDYSLGEALAWTSFVLWEVYLWYFQLATYAFLTKFSRLPLSLSFYQHPRVSVRGVGALYLRLCNLLLVNFFAFLLLVYVSATDASHPLVFTALALYIFGTTCYFVVPQIQLHSALMAAKERLLLEVSSRGDERFRTLLQTPSEQNRERLGEIESTLAIIERIGTWALSPRNAANLVLNVLLLGAGLAGFWWLGKAGVADLVPLGW
jgi:hypothetical protein